MGKFKEITKPETLKKVQKAKELKAKGMSVTDIASAMGLSESRIRELLKGVNWDSKS